ncbi:Amidase domain-containing protein [Mycena indigotica]|uniref:Amidase domain-containing protein n=1 Tax=Mycena indigotica TaxID=2126181 RepID=A0A8H6VTR7_9AGAR|nr:Amidase domain-containing protein [Mycena indigotica]KAF7289788.1 Amidase domain-containing protein [Mycena indigotica]
MTASSSSAHRRACASKRHQRQAQLDSFSSYESLYPQTLSDKIHGLSLAQLVVECSTGSVSLHDVLGVYGRKTLQAQRLTNCISDLMFDDALDNPAFVETFHCGEDSDTTSSNATLRDYPLFGVPINSVDIVGHDSTLGLSSRVDRPVPASSPIVRLLKDAGAIIHAKTTVPTCLFANETASDTFGLTTNPYNPRHGVGASTGGGAALLACGGSKIEIATDLAGSARMPAHFCGIYGLKGSIGRFPSLGTGTSMPGLESVQSVAAPMAAKLDDLEEFWRRVVGMKPWLYDMTCVPLPWQHVDLLLDGRKLKWGVIWDNGICPPTPACRRALSNVVHALKLQGHEVVDFCPPNVEELLIVGNQLVFADGGEQIRNAGFPGETLNRPLQNTLSLLALPRFVKRCLAFFTSDPFTSNLFSVTHTKSVVEERALVVRRDALREEWYQRWMEENLDFVLSVPHPLPALENGTGDKTSLLSAAYTFLWNMLDYTAGVLPVTTVDKELDSLPPGGVSGANGMTSAAKGIWSIYDATKMHGLPVGVQISGRRMEEEKVLEGMKVIEAALKAARTPYVAPMI